MKKNCNKVLFINYGGIGDEILFLPAIEGFKKLYPNAKVTLCLEPRAKGVKGLTNVIDDIITVDIKAGGIKKYINILKLIFKTWFMGFDTVISSGKSPFVAIILFLTGAKTKVGYKTKTSKLLNFEVPLNENVYAGNMYFDLIKPFGDVNFELPKINFDENFNLPFNFGENNFVLIHPGVSLMSINKGIFKCPDTNFWVETIKKLLEGGENVVIAGGPDDFETINKILENNEISSNPKFYSMFNKTKNLYELTSLMNKAKTIICCDSAPFHIASALNKEIYVLFGPTNEEKLVFKTENIKVIAKNLDCRPCLWDKRLTNCENSACIKFQPDDLLSCMK